MAYPQKFKDVMSILEERIRRGDFLIRPVPSERKLAEESGVSHMTARKAVIALLERKVLQRQANGTLSVAPEYHSDAGTAQVILLYPAYPSAFLIALRQAVTSAALARSLRIRPVEYVDWTDPVVVAAVNNNGGVIIIPSSPDLPGHLLEAIKTGRAVILQGDLVESGVPSIQLYPPRHLATVLDRLFALGHRRIDCISSHVHNPEIEARIDLWRSWSSHHSTTGELREWAAPSFSDPTPFAHKAMLELLDEGPLQATALVGTTFPAAVGAAKACSDRGIVVGRDVSISAMNIEWPAQFMTPTISGLDLPDFSTLLSDCFAWFASDHVWPGSKRLEPGEACYFAGQSTGPCEAVTAKI